ncbi:hypothetical protein C5167_009778 [Papaver somniferum]|uniref:Phytocyanin domain-containing protein n=1 Tax=Papaver somniferum TaxID=3469 RepID=A0A4Y7JYC1_PAPSO|nr:hypothetical protein C5167_009778 [Papaver somniferum]
MGVNSKLLFSFVLLAVAVPLMGNAVVWNVGDAAGWSGQAEFDYAHWAARPAFLVGDDSLRFVYDPSITNVLEVSYCDFKSCDATSPLATYNTGDDTVPITKDGHQYFISANSVDCRNGLKVDILAYDSPYLRYWRSDDGPNGYIAIPDMEPREDQTVTCESTKGTAASTPTTSPTSATSALAPPTSSASKFSSRSLFLVLDAALVVFVLGFAY